jgi:hypothetical protein
MKKNIEKGLNELRLNKKFCDNPGSYLDSEQYIKYEAMSQAYEEAIEIVERYLLNSNS